MRAGLRTTRGSFWRCCCGCGEKGTGYLYRLPAGEVRVVGIAGAGRAVSSTKVGYEQLGVVSLARPSVVQQVTSRLSRWRTLSGTSHSLTVCCLRWYHRSTQEGSHTSDTASNATQGSPSSCLLIQAKFHVIPLLSQPVVPKLAAFVAECHAPAELWVSRMEILILSISGPLNALACAS